MTDINRIPYELSLWQDVWDAEKSAFTDHLIAPIGSNNLKQPFHANGVTLERDINGTSTLTFTIFYKYRDMETGELTDNPFINMLVNERKVKIKYGKTWNYTDSTWDYEWRDYYIKTAQESSDKKSVTYICKDSFITELSKTGFSIELDPELENNQGTVTELAERVLKDTDWEVGESDELKQTAEDYIYEMTTVAQFNAKDSLTKATKTIPSGAKILAYYTCISGKTKTLQFLYDAEGYTADSNRIVSATEYSVDATYSEDTTLIGSATVSRLNVKIGATTALQLLETESLSEKYKGLRLVKKEQTTFDSVLDRYVSVGDRAGRAVHYFKKTEFTGPMTVANYVTNSKEMTSANGWYVPFGATALPYAKAFEGGTVMDIPVYLRIMLQAGQKRFMNTGFRDNRTLFPDGISKGDNFTTRIKLPDLQVSKVFLAQYSDVDPTVPIAGTTILTFTNFVKAYDLVWNEGEQRVDSVENGFLQSEAIATTSISQKNLFDVNTKYGLFFETASSTGSRTYYLQNAQCFRTMYQRKEAMKSDGTTQQWDALVTPDDVDVNVDVRDYYYYYDPETRGNNPDAIQYLYKQEVPWNEVTPRYIDNYGKVRSITESKSNCFNLIQKLAEVFECWAQFNVEHNEDGSLLLVQRNVGGKLTWYPKKTVTFVEQLGQTRSVGFKYGMNLVSIQRSLESEQIVSKLIVEKNSNEFADGGFCTISDAEDNMPKESVIFNFDYFIQQGLISYTEVLRDFYVTIGQKKGYLSELRDINLKIRAQNERLPGLNRAIDQQKYLVELYTSMGEDATTLESAALTNIQTLTKLTTVSRALDKASGPSATETEKRYYREYITYSNNRKTALKIVDAAKPQIIKLEGEIKATEASVEALIKMKEAVYLDMYKRYSRFIQEGSWIDENYIDPTLYYLDAQSVLYDSAFPKISYNINVIDLAALEEYRAYTYQLGDKTTIEDTEFFGYSDFASQTPYKEEVIISNILTNFDDPRSNRITIQNFQTQFQDLFSRITASTNSLQYNVGGYQRAAGAIEPSGEINAETLQNSLTNNSLRVASAQNESFVMDSNGITTIDLDNPNDVMKLQSKGLFLSTDGGATWTVGVRADGINTQALTAGAIRTDRIVIEGVGENAFRWDEHGLSAYSNLPELAGEEGGRSLYSFVRFDNYGLYGINNPDLVMDSNGNEHEYQPKSELQIWEDAQFGLTWKGLFIKNRYGNGRVEISSDNDVSIFEGDLQRIKLGNFGSPSSPQYGLIVKDEIGISRAIVGNIGSSQNPVYGLALRNDRNEVTVYTNDKGDFFGEHIYVGPAVYDPRAQLGVIVSYNQSGEEITADSADSVAVYSKIFAIQDENGTETIALYDNGLARFAKAEIQGDIIATGGKIGNLIITEDGFEGNGFSVGDGGVQIDLEENPNGFSLTRGDENIFSIIDGELTMIGSGSFTGTINATSGSFHGDIFAESGYIGGLIIKDSELYSAKAAPFNNLRDYAKGAAVWFDGQRWIAQETIFYTDDTPVPEPSADSTYWALDLTFSGADSPFWIDRDGNVVAKSILLGESATIESFMKLGNAYIYNPGADPFGRFLQVLDDSGRELISMSGDGVLSVGESPDRITIDGKQSLIAGNNWSIEPNIARFANVSVSGTIKTAVFEKGSIQTINSALMLTPSHSVKYYDFPTSTIWIEDSLEPTTGGAVISSSYRTGDWVVIADDNNKVLRKSVEVSVEPETIDGQPNPKAGLTKLVFDLREDKGEVMDPTTVALVGQEGQFHIGINSMDSDIFNLFPGRSISLSQVTGETQSGDLYTGVQTDKKLVLGRLNGIPGVDLPVTTEEYYGLYADLAYLKGSLICESEGVSDDNPIYSGLNTLTGAKNINRGDIQIDDDSRVIMWAGAKGTDDVSIQQAPFKITEKGYLYAQQGIFYGSVISNSIVTDSAIIAQYIRGSEQNQALHIFDTGAIHGGGDDHPTVVQGIVFSSIDGRAVFPDIGLPEHTDHVGIDSLGMKFYQPSTSVGIRAEGREDLLLDATGLARLKAVYLRNDASSGGEISSHQMMLTQNRIAHCQREGQGSEIEDMSVSFITGDGTDSNRIALTHEGLASLQIYQDKTVSVKDVFAEEEVIYGKSDKTGRRMEYKPVSNGYNLYVFGS